MINWERAHSLVADDTLARCVKCGGQRMRCQMHDDEVICYGKCYWGDGSNVMTPDPTGRQPR